MEDQQSQTQVAFKNKWEKPYKKAESEVGPRMKSGPREKANRRSSPNLNRSRQSPAERPITAHRPRTTAPLFTPRSAPPPPLKIKKHYSRSKQLKVRKGASRVKGAKMRVLARFNTSTLRVSTLFSEQEEGRAREPELEILPCSHLANLR